MTTPAKPKMNMSEAISKVLETGKYNTWTKVYQRITKSTATPSAEWLAKAESLFPDAFKPAPKPAPTECMTTPAPATPVATPAPAPDAPKAKKEKAPKVKPEKAPKTEPYSKGYQALLNLCLANDGKTMDEIATLAVSNGIKPDLGSAIASITVLRDAKQFANRGRTSCVNYGKGKSNPLGKVVSIRVLSVTPTRPDRNGNMAGMTEEDKASWPARLAAEIASGETKTAESKAIAAAKKEQAKAAKQQEKADRKLKRQQAKAAKQQEKAAADLLKAQEKAKAAEELKAKADADLLKAQTAAAASAEALVPGDSIPPAASEVSQTADTVAEVPAD